jgi:hypothetical protein
MKILTRNRNRCIMMFVLVAILISSTLPYLNAKTEYSDGLYGYAQDVSNSATTCPPCDNRTTYPIMRIDSETLREWSDLYNSAPRAYLNPGFVSQRGSFNVLDHLQYTPYQRNQGSCGNCWVWAGTGVLEVALDVQEGIKDRLSVQYFTSCYNGGTGPGWACYGGNTFQFADWYQDNGFAIPWSNTNAYWQDGNQAPEEGTSVPGYTISTSPNYPLSRCTAKTIETRSVGQTQAINNIKNILHQDKAVVFSFWLPNTDDWNVFFNFWGYQTESAIWSPDYSLGHTWSKDGGGGHAVLCVGYNDVDPNNPYWIMVNSWGTTDGRPNGIFHVDMNMNYDCTYNSDGVSDYSLSWETLDVGFVHTEELHYDDGAPEMSSYWNGPGGMFAVRFTTPTTGQLTESSFFVWSEQWPVDVKIHVMGADKKDLITPFVKALTSQGWCDVDLSGYGVTVSAGIDFYVAVEWTVANKPYLDIDTSSPHGRSWYGVNGNWSQYTDGDYLIRAEVQTVRSMELYYDDGTAEDFWFWDGPGAIGAMFAVRFTPPMSGRLMECSFFITDPATVKIHVMDKNRIDMIAPFSKTPTSLGWFHVDLSAFQLAVTSQVDFYVAIEWTVAGKPGLGTDLTSNPDGRSWDKLGSWSRAPLGDGDYLIRAVIETEAPDLIISDISWSPAYPVEGDTITFTVYIRNQGAGDAGFFKVAYYVDDVKKGEWSISSLAAGQTTSTDFTWTANEVRTHAVGAFADSNGVIAEIVNKNNKREETFDVGQKPILPDLMIREISWTPETPAAGSTVAFTVTIKNNGTANAGFFKTVCYIDQTKLGEWSIFSLLIGQEVNKTFSWTYVEGSHTVKAVADSNGEIQEGDETNNVREEIIGNRPPVASFGCNGYDYLSSPIAFVRKSTCFNATESYDPDGSIVSYCWDFGDGNVTTTIDAVITHNYTRIGSYSVTLNITDNQGELSTAVANITIQLKGDLNGDGFVNILDISIIGIAYNSRPGDLNWNPKVDFDKNNFINIIDLTQVAIEYGSKA